jgi:hypothetical protein
LEQIVELTVVELDTYKEISRFGHIFDAGLFDFNNDVQDICNADQ